MSRHQDLWKGEVGTEFALHSLLTPDEVDKHWWPWLRQSRTNIDNQVLGDLPRTIRILEVGCGVGNQLVCLEKLGFLNVYGCDINDTAVHICRKRGFPIDCCPANKLPYTDEAFDLIYTAALLIHIPEEESGDVQREIARVSKKWIYGYEYYSAEWTSRASFIGGLYPQGVPDFTFKAPFSDRYLANVPDLKFSKRIRVEHQDGTGNCDEAFLLEKL